MNTGADRGAEADKSWSAWYSAARDEMAFRYGMRRVPKDRYKEQFAYGKTPHSAVKELYENFHARGGSW